MQDTVDNLTLSEASMRALESQSRHGLSTAQKASRLIRTLSGESLETSRIDSKSSQEMENKPSGNSASPSPQKSKVEDERQSTPESVQDLMAAFSISREEAEQLMDIT